MSAASGRQPIADWPDPLTPKQLADRLRELANVAAEGANQDLWTVLELVSERARLAQTPELSLPECQQILRAVRVCIPRAGTWPSDLMVINKHLYTVRQGLDNNAAQQVLPDLFLAAAEHAENPRSLTSTEGVGDHA